MERTSSNGMLGRGKGKKRKATDDKSKGKDPKRDLLISFCCHAQTDLVLNASREFINVREENIRYDDSEHDVRN